jgi:molybdopterin converting factor small subunit
MTTVSFTSALQRFLETPSVQVEGDTVRQVLDAVFASRPALRGYVLDDQGAVRRHVAIYINGEVMRDRTHLSDTVRPQDEVYVFQALTGG